MAAQLSYDLNPAIGRAGMIADAGIVRHVGSHLASGPVAAGRGVFRAPGGAPSGASPGLIYQSASPASAADVDAIITAITSSTAIQVFDGTDLNGVVGDDEMTPARKVTLVLSSHADWDATNATLVGIVNGVQVSETLAIPNGGNTTVTSANYYDRVISLTIPAQSGTGGTATAGIAILDSSVTIADFMGVAVYDAMHEPASSTAEYGDEDTVPCLKVGAIWVVTEDACVWGGDAYVRVAGGDLGNFRSDADTANAVKIVNARWGRDSAIGGLNILEIRSGV